MMKVGIYARVSTHDQQTLPLQLKAMRQYVRQRKWKLVEEVEEVGSGANQRLKREEADEVCAPAGGGLYCGMEARPLGYVAP